MSVKVAGFQSSELFQQIKDGIEALPAATKKENVKKVNGIFQFDVSSNGKTQSWQLDLKSENGTVVAGTPGKADITIIVSDENFMKLANGQLNGQKAFMSGAIKVKGKMMLATKLDTVLKSAQTAKAKL